MTVNIIYGGIYYKIVSDYIYLNKWNVVDDICLYRKAIN